MAQPADFLIAVFPGDGIGPEVMRPCLKVLEAVGAAVGDLRLRYDTLEAGAELYRRSGSAMQAETFDRAREADTILLSAMGLPDVRHTDGTEIAAQLDLRQQFHLFAGVRPVKAISGISGPLADDRARKLDLVIIRESTEGLFAVREKGVLEGNEVARDTMEITRPVCQRLFDFAFRLAERRKAKGHPGIVTCVDKANVLGSFAFFRKIFYERAERFPDIQANTCYVDAAGLNLIKQPWTFDVLVTENMFGDILSDVGAALIGGMGFAPSADIGEEHAVFQPCHGSAPDIVGTGQANPTAMFLSAAMMLEWLGQRREQPACKRGARVLKAAVERTFADGKRLPFELGGTAGTEAIAERVIELVRSGEAQEQLESLK